VETDQNAGQTLAKLAPYADTLSYGVFSDSGYTNLWTSGVGGIQVSLTFVGNNLNASVSPAPPFYMRVASGQTDKAAGTYNNTLNVTVKDTNTSGATLGSTQLASQATVAKSCSFTVPSYSLTYQAFRSTALVDTSQSVAVTCSKGTLYDLTLDNTVGVIPGVQLTYGLVFTSSSGASVSSTSSTGNTAQTMGLTLTLPSGQAGACAAGSCLGSGTRQITMTF